MPLITLQEARSHLELPNENQDGVLQSAINRVVASAQDWLNVNYWAGASALSIYCSQSDATAATIAVTSTEVTLVITGGAVAGSVSVLFSGYATLTALVDQINAQTGWTAVLIGTGTVASTLLWEFAATSVLGAANTKILDYGLTQTEYFDGQRMGGVIDKAFLRFNPVTSITSIYDDIARDYGSDTLLDADDYIMYDWGVQLEGFKFQRGYKNVQIIYVGGFTPDTRKDSLVHALLRTLAYVWNRRKSEHLSMDSVSDLNIQTTFMTKLPRDIKNEYRDFIRHTI